MMTSPYYHLRNTVRETPGVYSCAIDSFLELCYYSFYLHLKDIAPHFTYFLDLVYVTCQRYETITSNAIPNMSFVYDLLSWEVRLPVWEYIRSNVHLLDPKIVMHNFLRYFKI